MRQRLIVLLVALGLLGLPALTLGASSADAGVSETYETRVVILGSGPGTQLYGRNFQVLAQLQASNGGTWLAVDDAEQDLVLQRRLAGAASWQSIATMAVSGADGRALFTTKVAANASYRVAYAGGTFTDNPAVTFTPSTSVTKAVKAVRDLGAKSRDLRGPKVRFFGKVSPSYQRKPVVLQRNTGSRWVTIGRSKTDARSRWTFVVTAKPTRGKWRYRTFTARTTQFQQSYSAVLTVCTNVPCG